MRFSPVLSLWMMLGSVLYGTPVLELAGVQSTGSHTQLLLRDKSTEQSRWVDVGGVFADCKVASYDASQELATLDHHGEKIRLHLVASKVRPASGSTQQQIVENLRTLTAAAKRYFADNGYISASFADLVGPGKLIPEIKPIDGENYLGLFFSCSSLQFSVQTASGAKVTYTLDEPFPLPREVVIRAGDTLARTSSNSGVSLRGIQDLNPDVNFSQLKIGQKLRLKP